MPWCLAKAASANLHQLYAAAASKSAEPDQNLNILGSDFMHRRSIRRTADYSLDRRRSYSFILKQTTGRLAMILRLYTHISYPVYALMINCPGTFASKSTSDDSSFSLRGSRPAGSRSPLSWGQALRLTLLSTSTSVFSPYRTSSLCIWLSIHSLDSRLWGCYRSKYCPLRCPGDLHGTSFPSANNRSRKLGATEA